MKKTPVYSRVIGDTAMAYTFKENITEGRTLYSVYVTPAGSIWKVDARFIEDEEQLVRGIHEDVIVKRRAEYNAKRKRKPKK